MNMATVSKPSMRVFINHVDEYQGYYISRYLSKCVVGASLEENEEEEEEGSGQEGEEQSAPKEGCYEVYGTLKNPKAAKPNFVKEIISFETREQLYDQLLECDVILYDITQYPDQIEESMWALSELHHNIEKLEKRKIFILLSTVMTWAKSSPADEEDPESPLTEEDYKKRKPHPNYKEHLTAEKTTVKYGKTRKSRLLTYIVATGLTYGCGERIFHSFFKAAWHNAADLPIYGNGQNVLPMIHVTDLAAIIQNIADSRPKVKYLVAVDDSQGQTLEAVVKSISSGLTTGKARTVTKEEAALSKEIDQATLEQLTMSLRLDAVFVKENFRIDWVCETGLVESVDQVVKEFKTERGLLPIKLCILGPPASGKTTIAKQLCQRYKLHHVAVKDVIDEAIASLQRSAARADVEEEDDDGRAAEDAETLEQVNESLADNDGRLADEFVIRFFREKLGSKPCQNQGFVLDGFPKTKEAAEALFGVDEEEEEEEEEGDQTLSRKLLPEAAFVLEADDEFLKRRVMELSESAVCGTHNTEHGLLRRLAEFRRLAENDESATEFFEANEMPPLPLNVVEDASPMHAALADVVAEIVGRPRNYGLSDEELLDIQRREEEQRLEEEKRIRDQVERLERMEAEERQRRQQDWSSRLSATKFEEQQQLEARSEPLRNYLLHHVMPSLTKGLVECATAKPEDAIDYLAEYLFRNNPQID